VANFNWANDQKKSTKGKTVFFYCVVLLGYTFGIIHKCIYDINWVLVVYILNLVLVVIDTIVFIYIKNKYEKVAAHGV